MEANREDIDEFLKEGREYFDEVEPLLIKLLDEKDGAEAEKTIATAFRIFHSVKGVSGFLSLSTIQGVTHKVEEVLDRVRSGALVLNDDILKSIFNALDFIKELFQLVHETSSDTGRDNDASGIINDLVKHLPNDTSGAITDFNTSSSNLLACLNQPQFLSSLKSEFLIKIEQIETISFDLLDKPDKYEEVLTNILNGLEILHIHANFFVLDNFLLIYKEFIPFLKQDFCGRFESANVSVLFTFMSLLRDNTFSDSSVENLTKALEDLKATEGFTHSDNQTVSEKASEQDVVEVNTDDNTAVSTKPQEQSAKVVKEIRVDLEKIDKLVELIEELGVVSGVVASDPESNSFDIHSFNQGINKLGQITSSLQDVAMSVRLVPLSSTFNKMNRLVYDVSNKLNKKVKLSISGDNTEIDKNMIEAIQDPLVHIFRNAIDHGIEMPDEREANKKSSTGLIELKAWHSGGEVHISIQDDGHGIDANSIKQKAVKKGIISELTAEKMPNEMAYNLIMEAGFSTAEVVTDFSGRGVGMDVVKKSIEKLNGRISIDSHYGFGTTFSLSFPLTSTIVEGMLVKVGSLKYTIRIASIVESFKVKSEQVFTTPGGQERVKLRNEIFPIFRLAYLNKTSQYITDISEGILVLVEAKEQSIALFVDDIIGTNQSVIKSLPKYFGRLKGVSGCSVIGTRSSDISWTVDINGLIG